MNREVKQRGGRQSALGCYNIRFHVRDART